MTTPLAAPTTEASSTLYFGPWYRRSPFFEKTLEAGCSAYDKTASIPFIDPKKSVPLG
jgi:hypothetical protein